MEELVKLENVSKIFTTGRTLFSHGELIAVDDVTLSIFPGEAVGIVGESGCGKSTTARLLLDLETPTSGEVRWARLAGGSRAVVRAVFQNPRSSLNPRRRVGSLLEEAVETKKRKLLGSRDLSELVAETLTSVGLLPEHAGVYPHQLSGGQQQRVAIACAIITQPDLIVLDEPTSALDVSIAAQIINLLMRLRKELDCAFLLITHDLPVARLIADRLAVMYLGRIVELGPAGEMLESPSHHYTRSLVLAEPVDHPSRRVVRDIVVHEPSPDGARPSGCAFHPRCSSNDGAACVREVPLLTEVGDRRQAACYHPLHTEASSAADSVGDAR